MANLSWELPGTLEKYLAEVCDKSRKKFLNVPGKPCCVRWKRLKRLLDGELRCVFEMSDGNPGAIVMLYGIWRERLGPGGVAYLKSGGKCPVCGGDDNV